MERRNHNRTIHEVENKNPNQFRRDFNRRWIFQRERRNNDPQNIQPPLQNNCVDELDEPKNVESNNEINLVGEDQSVGFLTHYDYEGSLSCNQLDKDMEENISLSYSIYQND